MQKEMEDIDTLAGNLKFYKVSGDKPKGGLIIIHEVWGLTDHIKDVADRFAAAGYLVVAPDLLAGTELEKLITPEMFENFTDLAKRAQTQLDFRKIMTPLQSPEFGEQTLAKLKDLYKWLVEQPATGGKVAAVGYCFGGTYSFALAASEPEMVAAVPYYGHANHDIKKLKNVRCPIMAFYGEKDENLMTQLPDLIDNMNRAGVNFQHKVYPGTGHAFFNDKNPTTYDKTAAEDSWKMTLDFLEQNFNKAKD